MNEKCTFVATGACDCGDCMYRKASAAYKYAPGNPSVRTVDIDGTYFLCVEQRGDEAAPHLRVHGCDCTELVRTPEKARELAKFLTDWADERDTAGEACECFHCTYRPR